MQGRAAARLLQKIGQPLVAPKSHYSKLLFSILS